MSEVRTEIDIAAAPEDVWAVIMDPQRYGDWVTIHRRLEHIDDGALRPGFAVEQTLALRGAPFKVSWELAEVDPPHSARWEGRGPGGSRATTSYLLVPGPGPGTRFEYANDFKAPGGFVGAAASRALVGGISRREADRSLGRLKALLEH